MAALASIRVLGFSSILTPLRRTIIDLFSGHTSSHLSEQQRTVQMQSDLEDNLDSVRDFGDAIMRTCEQTKKIADVIDGRARKSSYNSSEIGLLLLLEWMSDKIGRGTIENKVFRRHSNHGCHGLCNK